MNCSLSSNNILNPATPYGDCSLIRMANLYANVLQVDRPAKLRECFGMLTDMSARLLNLRDYGFAVGNPADVVVLAAALTGLAMMGRAGRLDALGFTAEELLARLEARFAQTL